MTLSQELLEILACPRCKGRVRLTPGDGSLGCPSCRVAYPVVDGIPVMLVGEAVPWAPEDATGPESR